MRELSLFSGAGGGLLATRHLLGWTTIGYVEYDDYCQRVLRARIDDGYLDDAPIFGDIRTFVGEGFAHGYTGMVDVITAGFPCQAHSTASRGRPRADRDLWSVTADVIRIVQPAWVFLENVPRAFGEPVFTACPGALGAPHRRRRGWLAAHADGDGEPRRAIDAEMAGLPEISGSTGWSPDVACSVGVDDGLAHRVDRLRALGNGQVPAVAASVWRLLTTCGG